MDITYCSRISCSRKSCGFHQINAPDGVDISITDRGSVAGCYRSDDDHQSLRLAICRGTQKTAYRCSDSCKSLCNSNGDCAFCSVIAEEISKDVYVNGK